MGYAFFFCAFGLHLNGNVAYCRLECAIGEDPGKVFVPIVLDQNFKQAVKILAGERDIHSFAMLSSCRMTG